KGRVSNGGADGDGGPSGRGARRGGVAGALDRLSRILRDIRARGGLPHDLCTAALGRSARVPRAGGRTGRAAGRADALPFSPPLLADRERRLSAGSVC